MSEQQAALNTDREIWRGKSRAEFGDPDRFYADSIFVTADGEGIGMNCGGYVIVKPLREWFALANSKPAETQPDAQTLDSAWKIAERIAATSEFAGTCPSVGVMAHLISGIVKAAEQRATQAGYEAGYRAALEAAAKVIAEITWPIGTSEQSFIIGLRYTKDVAIEKLRAISASAQTPSEEEK